SCNYRGAIGAAFSSGATSRPKQEESQIDIPVSELNEEAIKFLAEKFQLPRTSIHGAGIGWVGEGAGHYSRRFHFPIYGPDSKQRGSVYRSYEGVLPKSLNKVWADTIALSWYRWL